MIVILLKVENVVFVTTTRLASAMVNISIYHTGFQPELGCVIVNPKSEQVLAVSHDLRDQHPLHHAVMVAIDLIAKSQGGGTYNFHSGMYTA